jgi:hypothetical protein
MCWFLNEKAGINADVDKRIINVGVKVGIDKYWCCR